MSDGRCMKKFNPNLITCDQVTWLLDIADRYLPKDQSPRVSRQREMKKYGMLYEIMEVANLEFSDDSARHNGTPNEARVPEYDIANPNQRP